MKNILLIGHNELRLFLKSRASFVWLFLLPLAFVAGMKQVHYAHEASNRFPPVRIENADTGFLGNVFIDVLSAQRLWRHDPVKQPKVRPVLSVRIPADFTQRVLAQKASNVELAPVPGSEDAQGDAMLIEARLLRALVALNSHLLEASTRGTAWPPDEAKLRAVIGRPAVVELHATFAGRDPVPSGIGFSLPGNLVFFLMMNLLIFGGATVAATRNSGVLRRLLTAPVRRGELIAGQLYGLWLLGGVQIVFLLLAGKLLFHLNLGANAPGVLLVLLVFAWVSAALGVLIGSLLNAPDRVVGVCILASLLMAGVGGCWFPLELAPDSLRLAGHCVPSGWALDALHRLISFGGELGSVVKPLAVLAGFGAAATAAAARWFRV
ncbi:MAG TPA: ABC transporter permease [Opitutaceae bacterium]|nr:ABC transporter permease [Opitutaceae bacterium]